jgi:hypothetical protein
VTLANGPIVQSSLATSDRLDEQSEASRRTDQTIRSTDFTRKVYDEFAPLHLQRIRSAIAQLPDPSSESITSEIGVGALEQEITRLTDQIERPMEQNKRQMDHYEKRIDQYKEHMKWSVDHYRKRMDQYERPFGQDQFTFTGITFFPRKQKGDLICRR